MAMKMGVCAYCGKTRMTEEEHVVARSFALEEMEKNCHWVIVRSCPKCNRRFSKDEPYIRGFVTVINAVGETLIKDAMFEGPVLRNWRRPESRGDFTRTMHMIRKPDGSGLSSENELLTEKNLVIVPDENVLRGMRKIVRGLYYHHFTEKRGLEQVLPDSQVSVTPFYDFTEERRQCMYGLPNVHFIHEAVFGYAFAECSEGMLDLPGVDSIWLLNWCKGPMFAGIVKSNGWPYMHCEAELFKIFTRDNPGPG